jgi:steroid delta-isomerase-like uncharacterized protein
MRPEETEAIAHRWHMDVVQKGNLGAADEILASDIVAHMNGQDIPGIEGAKQLAAGLRTAFPDIQIKHHETVTSGDLVAIRWTSDSTHRGDYFGIPPTGKPIHVEGIDIFRLRDGKIAESWVAFDNATVLRQMGVIPEPEQATA